MTIPAEWLTLPFDRYSAPSAACRGCDPNLWYPGRGESGLTALAVCSDCPVRPQCLDWAIENNERFGIWGGVSERKRRRMRSARRKEEAA